MDHALGAGEQGGQVDPGARCGVRKPVEDAALQVIRGGQALAGVGTPACGVEHDHVGEGPADINGHGVHLLDSPGRFACRGTRLDANPPSANRDFQ